MASTTKTFDTLYEPPVFQWAGTDPALNGWTKHGAGTTAANGTAWEIDTLLSDAATYYSHNFWFNNPFIDGISIVVQPPTIVSTDGAALPNKSVILACDDGTHRYELEFDSIFVYLNGGTGRAHHSQPVTLLVAAGGLTADLEIGRLVAESGTAFIAGSAVELIFGDKATTDDSDAIWQLINWWPGLCAEGGYIPITGQSVKLYDATIDAAAGDISTITDSDNDGVYPAGSISSTVATLVRARVEAYRGMAFYTEWESD